MYHVWKHLTSLGEHALLLCRRRWTITLFWKGPNFDRVCEACLAEVPKLFDIAVCESSKVHPTGQWCKRPQARAIQLANQLERAFVQECVSCSIWALPELSDTTLWSQQEFQGFSHIHALLIMYNFRLPCFWMIECLGTYVRSRIGCRGHQHSLVSAHQAVCWVFVDYKNL